MRVSIAFGVGVVVTAIIVVAGSWGYAAAAGWDAAAAVFLALTWWRVGPMDGRTTRAHATREDATQRTTDIILGAASVASLASVVVLLVRASTEGGVARIATIALGLATIVLSWFVVHTVFALRYARQYYAPPVGGIDFENSADDPREDPAYSDFAYVSFVLGMTYQVSDTNISSHAIRMSVLRQSMLSYLFGTFVLAAAVNLFVTLGT
ncbi:DUF1345 domain-containing protein [Rhodococcus rhodnii]|uniref:DUF1345 domain-containing protein n=1 Tax=Rhodococcus rhodnii TaxID=38312 RepID=A0A6P2CJ17_9NOCA|nr:DUF1345 domain-containing protein [Rhodococcus rhodnii]